MKQRQYAVDVLERYSHGIYGKEKYTSWLLSETSKARACCFAAEIVAGMTWREILKEKYGHDNFLSNIFCPWGCKLDDQIGHEGAEKYFSYRASIEEA